MKFRETPSSSLIEKKAPPSSEPTSGGRPFPWKGALVIFVLAVVLFVGSLAGAVWWLGNNLVPMEPGKVPPLPSRKSSPEDALAERLASARQAAQKRHIRVYFTADGSTLQAQILEMNRPIEDSPQRLRFILTELFKGPATGILRSPIPFGVQLRGLYIWRNTAVVDLSREFREMPQGGPMAEMLCLYALVNTVVENMEGIEQVRILVEGEEAGLLWDQVDLSRPFQANLALIR